MYICGGRGEEEVMVVICRKKGRGEVFISNVLKATKIAFIDTF